METRRDEDDRNDDYTPEDGHKYDSDRDDSNYDSYDDQPSRSPRSRQQRNDDDDYDENQDLADDHAQVQPPMVGLGAAEAENEKFKPYPFEQITTESSAVNMHKKTSNRFSWWDKV